MASQLERTLIFGWRGRMWVRHCCGVLARCLGKENKITYNQSVSTTQPPPPPPPPHIVCISYFFGGLKCVGHSFCICRPFIICEGCLDSTAKQVRYRLSQTIPSDVAMHPSLANLATHPSTIAYIQSSGERVALETMPLNIFWNKFQDKITNGLSPSSFTGGRLPSDCKRNVLLV